ncbi:hypothetical protein F5Y19DRAFT_451400 [Xylariaceae sp. FL1651]|nr:hypothetical protein F5Y19DRAFT_451400 [Xylariaceae sp. FL1651]
MPVLNALWRGQAASSFSLPRISARAPRPSASSPFARPPHRIRNRHFQSNDSKPPSPSSDPTSTADAQTHRISRILTRASRFLPTRLHTSLQNLRSAPLSHIGAFLILHEITAVLPIFGLTYLFYALDWVPTSWILGPWAAWAEDGLKKYVPWFRKKRWFGLEGKDQQDGGDGEEVLEGELREEVEKEKEREGRDGKKGWLARFTRKGDAHDSGHGSAPGTPSEESADEEKSRKAGTVWRKVKQVATVDNTEKGYKIGIQIAAAYTITKFLLVPRIALSLWLTPWLARSFVGFRRAVWKKRG